jgi:hypothetical protein
MAWAACHQGQYLLSPRPCAAVRAAHSSFLQVLLPELTQVYPLAPMLLVEVQHGVPCKGGVMMCHRHYHGHQPDGVADRWCRLCLAILPCLPGFCDSGVVFFFPAIASV